MAIRSGPLVDLKILEFAGIGPAPFCGMLLSDLGADVIRIDRKDGKDYSKFDVTTRGRRSISMDLKNPAAVEAVFRLCKTAEALIEGFRPGVMERLGLGPEAVLRHNPGIVYGRMTGWGQDGPLADKAGHDINYIAISGALHAIGTAEQPVIPLNLVGDYGGGALYLAFGLLAGIMHARKTGQGQVIDTAMSDGSISLMSMFYGQHAAGLWQNSRGTNIIDGGAHFYNVYQCADGKWLSLGAIEPKFYAQLLEKAGLTDKAFELQHDHGSWPELKHKLAQTIKSKTRDEWCQLLDGSDVCAAPVLDLEEAANHAHNQARGIFQQVNGVTQPGPVPRFSITPGQVQSGPAGKGEHNQSALADWGFSEAEIDSLRQSGAL